jgi:RimJ/RimL family protein N-acetyltransferase
MCASVETTQNISVTVYPDYRRPGYAARAVQLARRYAREAMCVNRTVAVIDAENIASGRAAENAGFVLDGPGRAVGRRLSHRGDARYVLRLSGSPSVHPLLRAVDRTTAALLASIHTRTQ